MKDPAALVVARDNGVPGNTHFVGYVGIVVTVIGIFTPAIVGHFHPSVDVASAFDRFADLCLALGYGGAYASRPGWVAPPAAGKLEQ